MTPMQATSEVTVEALVPSFVRHLRAENKSEGTVVAYLRGTDGLARFLADRGMPQDVASVRRERVESYIEDCLTRFSPATANQRFRSLQAFFKWATDEGEVTENPMRWHCPPT